MAGTRVQDERWNVSAQVDRAVDRAVNRAVNRVSALAAFRICVGSLLSQALSANGPAPGSDGQPVSKHFLKTPSQPIRKFSPISRHVRNWTFKQLHHPLVVIAAIPRLWGRPSEARQLRLQKMSS